MAGPGTSGGTRASMAGMLFEHGFALRDGRVVPERVGSRVRAFDVAGRSRTRASIPGGGTFALSCSASRLGEADVFLGLPPAAARGLSAVSAP
ncbi:hypothetical protein ACWEKR_11195 [Nocardia sp. NPDC004573]